MSDTLILPRFSHSQLTLYMDCGEKYRLERRHRMGGSASWALVGGKAFHTWTEVYDKGVPIDPAYFLTIMDGEVRETLASDRNSAIIEGDIRPTGRKSKDWPNKRDRSWWEHHGPIFCQQYIDWRASEDNELMPAQSVDGLEFHTEMKAEGTLGGLEVLGFVDRLITDSPFGKPVIMDLKGLPLDTKLVTPTGWTTMGEVEVGDEVFDKDGAITRVTAKSGVKRIGTYRINFHDGTSMVVDSEHIVWAARRYGEPRGVPVQEIVDSPRAPNGAPLWRVPIAGALDTPDTDLPIPPYVLGAWLGDGQESRCVVTKSDELFEEIEAEGVALGKRQNDGRSAAVTRTLLGYREKLDGLGVLGNKHIPQAYLRGGYEQRLALLRGLMDTDGGVNIARRRAVFTGCNEGLVRQVAELIRTIGARAIVQEGAGMGFGKPVTFWRVEFTSPVNPFRRPSQAEKWERYCSGKNLTLSQWLTVKSVEIGPDVETQCIAVDSPSRTYLATERMIPTHNTGREPGTLLQLATYAVLMSEQLGVEIKHGAFYLAEKGELSRIHDLSRFTREYIESLYEQAARGIAAGVFLPNPNSFCNSCPVRQNCGLYGGALPLDVPLLEPQFAPEVPPEGDV